MGCLIEECRALGRNERPSLVEVSQVLHSASGVDEGVMAGLRRVDPRRPYGRRVFLETPGMEGMVATWTRAFPCAPHDHGGSAGGVRVLRGQAIHRVWKVEDGELSLVREELRRAGEVLVCGPDLVHSMGDGGGEEPLVTLHLYVDPIQHMVVYDVATRRTLVVDGGCGAWIPVDEPGLVRCSMDGLVRHPI